MQLLHDANNQSRVLIAELGGAVAMSSSAAAIAIAGGMRMLPAFALSGLVIARAIPAIVTTRTLLARANGEEADSRIAIALHGVAVILVATFASPAATVGITLLLLRATWTLSHPVPPARTLAWQEAGWGAAFVALVVIGNIYPRWP